MKKEKDVQQGVANQATKDTSPIVPQRSKLKYNLNIYERPDLTEKQKEFINLCLKKETKLMFVEGPAGCGKTWLSVFCALKLLNEKRVSDLIYVRSAVECSEKSLGFLPGELSEKMSVYIQPLIDKLEELLPVNQIEGLKKEDRISGMPISFLRGLHWNAKFVCLDEGQNTSYKELITLITRIGQFSKVVVAGDSSQNDLNGKSGFLKILNRFDDEESRKNGIYVFRFTEEDIVRSSLVKFIVKKLNAAI